ncbi:hypothetical protein CRP9_gp21 [Roseobacter phage CRP-9]|nr:hypothetical protein CRP9_gp21 [Roseobacter phage CRP-9]
MGQQQKGNIMVWVLVWIQMTTSQGVEYYQINSFPKKDECTAALDKAQVMLNHQGEAVVCLEVTVK